MHPNSGPKRGGPSSPCDQGNQHWNGTFATRPRRRHPAPLPDVAQVVLSTPVARQWALRPSARRPEICISARRRGAVKNKTWTERAMKKLKNIFQFSKRLKSKKILKGPIEISISAAWVRLKKSHLLIFLWKYVGFCDWNLDVNPDTPVEISFPFWIEIEKWILVVQEIEMHFLIFLRRPEVKFQSGNRN